MPPGVAEQRTQLQKRWTMRLVEQTLSEKELEPRAAYTAIVKRQFIVYEVPRWLRSEVVVIAQKKLKGYRMEDKRRAASEKWKRELAGYVMEGLKDEFKVFARADKVQDLQDDVTAIKKHLGIKDQPITK